MARAPKQDVEATEAEHEPETKEEVPLTKAEQLVAVLQHAYDNASGVTPWMIETAREIASGGTP